MAHPIIDVHLDDSTAKELLLAKHCEFLSNNDWKDDCTLDYMKMSGIYWTLTALDLINELEVIEKDKVIDLVLSCHNSNGGFSPAPGHDSHLLSTLSAIQVLALFNELERVNADTVSEYVLTLQQSDGSFVGDQWGEVDTRFSFCALASLKLLDTLNKCIANGKLNAESCADYLQRCQNLDGGFGTRPGSESHAGQAYCVVGAMSILQQLRRLDLERAAWWLAERQLPSGGLNGRPEKKPDVCYSWWIVATLTILGRLVWIDDRRLVQFILASQDTATGGMADRPGDYPDPFHTLFGLAGLSLISHRGQARDDGVVSPAGRGEMLDRNVEVVVVVENGDLSSPTLTVIRDSVKAINPVFCMPQHVIDRMQLTVQLIN